MVYKFEEYERVMDTPNKKLEERTVVERILSILNKGEKYKSLEDFCKENSNFETFKNNNELTNVLKHFGGKLEQQDYDKILQSLKNMIAKKSTFDKNDIKTTDIDENQYVSYKNENNNIYLNNSYSNKPIEEQMKDLQLEMPSFQTSDTKKNTELIINEMKEKKKINLILRYLNEINFEVLNSEQQELFKFAFDYQQRNPGLIRLDLDEKVIIDENDNIMKIEKIDGNFVLNKGNDIYSKPEKQKLENLEPEESKNSKSLNLMPKIQLFS